MALKPLRAFARGKAILVSKTVNKTSASGASIIEKSYDEENKKTVICHFEPTKKQFETDGGNIISTSAFFMLEDIKINTGDRIDYLDNSYYVKVIEKFYDYPNVEKVHHLEVYVDNG